MSDFPVVSPVAAAVAGSVCSPITGSDSGRWYLHWGGVNQYAQHSAWSMSGFGDRIEFSFVADDPGNGTQKLYEADGSIWYLRINASTGVLRASYSRLSDGAQIVIDGPTVTAGEVYTGSVSLNADGAVLLVNGNAYSSAHTPKLSDCAIEYIATNSLINECFPGTIHYLRYVNATALQGVNAVMGNGVDLYGTIPTVTLTGDFEIEFWWRRQDRTGTDSQRLLQNPEDDFDAGIAVFDSANPTSPDALRVENDAGVFSTLGNAFINIAQGQDVHVQVSRSGDVLSAVLDGVESGAFAGSLDGSITLGLIGKTPVSSYPTNSTISNLKITDKSGAEDVVYQYDLSGDDGDVIPNVDPVTGVLGDEVHDYGESAIAVGEGTHAFKDGSGVYRAARDGALVGQINLIPADEIEAGTYLLRFNAYEDSQEAGNWIDIREGGSPLIQRALTDGEAVEVVVDLGGTFNLVMFGGPTVGYSWRMDDFSCKPYPHGTWQNYDSGVDQVALPKLSRYYKIADGPNATHLADSWGADAIGAELFNVAESDWDRSKT